MPDATTTAANQSVDWKKVIDASIPPIVVTEEVREETKRESGRFRGSMRISQGLFYTDKEYAEMRQEELKHKLP